MNLFEKLLTYKRFEMDQRRLLIQGALIMLSGATLAMPSTLNRVGCTAFFTASDQQHNRFQLGFLECLDAALAKETRDLQVGRLDTVSANDYPQRNRRTVPLKHDDRNFF